MVGDGILTFAIIFIVVIFVYMSLRLQREKEAARHFGETYSIQLIKDFMGDSISLFIDDNLVMSKQIEEEPTTVEVGRFAEQNTLMIVNDQIETVAAFDPSKKGGTYRFGEGIDGIEQLPQK